MSKRRKLYTTALVTVAAAALVTAGQAGTASSAARSSTTYLLKATLDAKNEVPAPKDATSAKGIFTARLTVAGKKSTFVWHLTLSGLSGRATAARVQFGAAGKAGPIALTLCRPCRRSADGGYTGPYVATPTFLKAILHGGMYSNIQTKLNPKGEIRGQINAKAAG